MDIRRIDSEDGLPVDLEELKADLRIDDDDFDDTLRRMSATAAALIERRSGYVLVPGTFEALVDSWCGGAGPSIFRSSPDPWTFVKSPFRELVLVEAMTGRNTWTDFDTDQLQVIERARDFELRLFSGIGTLPHVCVQSAGIKVQFRAGFDLAALESGETTQSEDQPRPLDPLVRGVFIALVGHYYENRELFAADKLTEIESTSGGLLNSIRYFF